MMIEKDIQDNLKSTNEQELAKKFQRLKKSTKGGSDDDSEEDSEGVLDKMGSFFKGKVKDMKNMMATKEEKQKQRAIEEA